MREIVRPAVHADRELAAELYRRGLFQPEERPEFLRVRPEYRNGRLRPLGTVRFATLLARGDAQLAARAVLREILTRAELRWLDRLLGFGKRNYKRAELLRTVERAMERPKANGR